MLQNINLCLHMLRTPAIFSQIIKKFIAKSSKVVLHVIQSMLKVRKACVEPHLLSLQTCRALLQQVLSHDQGHLGQLCPAAWQPVQL